MVFEVSSALFILFILEAFVGTFIYYLAKNWNNGDSNIVVAKVYGLVFIIGVQVVGIPMALADMGYLVWT